MGHRFPEAPADLLPCKRRTTDCSLPESLADLGRPSPDRQQESSVILRMPQASTLALRRGSPYGTKWQASPGRPCKPTGQGRATLTSARPPGQPSTFSALNSALRTSTVGEKRPCHSPPPNRPWPTWKELRRRWRGGAIQFSSRAAVSSQSLPGAAKIRLASGVQRTKLVV
jgi:hypothetical protein